MIFRTDLLGLANADRPGNEPALPAPAEPLHRYAARQAASGIQGDEPRMRAANAKLGGLPRMRTLLSGLALLPILVLGGIADLFLHRHP